jgi:hypothetical protein
LLIGAALLLLGSASSFAIRGPVAFPVSDDVFDAAYRRPLADRIPIWADPHRGRPGEINHHYGGRGV